MSKQTQSNQSDEYRNFKELTKNLLAVPKKEYDKQHAAFEKKNKKEKPAK